MMMKTKLDLKKHKYLVSLITTWMAGFLVIGVCYFAFHSPKKEQLEKLQTEHNQSRDLLLIAEKAQQQEVRDTLKQRFDAVNETVQQFSVPHNQKTGLVFEIGKLANDLGLLEFSSKNRSVNDYVILEKDSEVTEAWLNVEFKSSFEKFARFVNRLERQAPVVFIEEITFQRDNDEQSLHEVEMDLSFLVRKKKSAPMALANTPADSVLTEDQTKRK